MLRRPVTVLALAVLATLALAPPASAHVDLEPAEAVAGATELLSFSVAYEGSATTGLIVQLPEGSLVTDLPETAGWEATADSAEGTVTWSGGSTSEDAVFTVVVQLPATPGEVLFPTIQQTAAGAVSWIEGEEGEGEEGRPAPRLTLVADPNASSTTTTESTTTTQAPITTEADLPGTTLEAQERDDGNTSAAPWIIGSGIVALVAIAVGGTILKRRAG